MPYGYYQLIRIVAMFGFGIIAYHYYDREQNGLSIVFVVLALLFQPILKINLGRELWNMIDIIVAIFLIVLCIIEFYQTNHHEKE